MRAVELSTYFVLVVTVVDVRYITEIVINRELIRENDNPG